MIRFGMKKFHCSVVLVDHLSKMLLECNIIKMYSHVHWCCVSRCWRHGTHVQCNKKKSSLNKSTYLLWVNRGQRCIWPTLASKTQSNQREKKMIWWTQPPTTCDLLSTSFSMMLSSMEMHHLLLPFNISRRSFCMHFLVKFQLPIATLATFYIASSVLL